MLRASFEWENSLSDLFIFGLGSITRVIGKLIQVDKGQVITARKSTMSRQGKGRLSRGGDCL